MPVSSLTSPELGDDRWRDFKFLTLTLVVFATFVWMVHVALFGIEVRRVPMMRVGMVIGIYMAFMVHARLATFIAITAVSVAVGELHSRLMPAAVRYCDCFWLSFACGLALWWLTALVFAVAGSRLTYAPRA